MLNGANILTVLIIVFAFIVVITTHLTTNTLKKRKPKKYKETFRDHYGLTLISIPEWFSFFWKEDSDDSIRIKTFKSIVKTSFSLLIISIILLLYLYGGK